MSNKILDNGTILTLGLVGAVAAIGAAAQRGVYGSRAKHMGTVGGGMEFVHGQPGRPPMLRMRSDMSLAARLNDHGFAFEEVERGLLVDDAHDILIRIEGGMADIEKRKMDANGNLTGMKSLGEFPVHSVVNMVAAMRGGSRATSASKAPSLGEYDDFVVATKSKGNKHAYYIEGHDGDLDDGWYYNSITWGVDLAGPYDNAADALRNA